MKIFFVISFASLSLAALAEEPEFSAGSANSLIYEQDPCGGRCTGNSECVRDPQDNYYCTYRCQNPSGCGRAR